MSAPRPASSPPAAPDEACALCGRPRSICVCDRTTLLETRHRVLILQHPREQDVELGSARLAAMSLRRAQRVVGLSWASLAQATGDEHASPRHWAVVFPAARPRTAPAAKGASRSGREAQPDAADAAAGAGTEVPAARAPTAVSAASAAAPAASAASVSALIEEAERTGFALVDRKGEPVRKKAIEGIIVLDGSWSQAKTLWWRNPWLLTLHRLVLHPPEPSIYGTLRPEPRREYVSTLEAVGAALTALGEDPGVEAQLRRVFRTLVQRARDARRGGTDAGGAGGRRERLQRRRRVRRPARPRG